MNDSKEQLAKALEEIAKNHLGIHTLHTQDSEATASTSTRFRFGT